MTLEPGAARELALTFDDAPVEDSVFFKTHQRTQELIRKLKDLHVPPVFVFANGCRRPDAASVVEQLRAFRRRGDFVENHTCNHVRLDDVGPAAFIKDAEKNDKILSPLFEGQKFFRFPYSNEGTDVLARDQIRQWLESNHYRNGFFSIDDADYLFSFKIIEKGKIPDKNRLRSLFVHYLMGAVAFYDDLAVKTLGYSPKHVMLLHVRDATVLFVDDFIKELRSQKWTIIDPREAYKDPLYSMHPKNTFTGFGIIAQLAFEKTGKKVWFGHDDDIQADIDRVLMGH
jgi:peptidoglycan/xylan/chitin deacetylase (PgdA/CDA1 family)